MKNKFFTRQICACGPKFAGIEKGMGINMKKITYLLLSFTMCMFLFPLSAKAAGTTWETKTYNDWVLKDDATGTDIEISLRDTALYVKGKGAIPDFPKDSLGNRPWYDRTIYSIYIEQGITSIGADAFSHYPNLSKVELPSSIFIEDPSAFGALQEECHFYFYGTSIASRNIGNFPYTNMDTLATFIQKYQMTYFFHFDNFYMISYLNSGLAQKLHNVAPCDAVTPDFNPNYPLINYNADIRFPSSLGIQYQKQGMAAVQTFSIMLGNNQYAGTYNIYSMTGDKNLNSRYANNPAQVCMKIPNYYIYPGRHFGVVQILPGGIIQVFEDMDPDDETITFITPSPVATYMLYYTN